MNVFNATELYAIKIVRDFPRDPVIKTALSQGGDPGSIPGQGTRSPVLQL